MRSPGAVDLGRSGGPGAAVAALGGILVRGASNLQQTNALVWMLIAISAAGSIVTFGFLVYAILRFRDPSVKGRRYG